MPATAKKNGSRGIHLPRSTQADHSRHVCGNEFTCGAHGCFKGTLQQESIGNSQYTHIYIYVYMYVYNLKGPPNGWYRPDWLRFLVPWQLGPRTLDVRGSDYGAPGNRCRQSKKGLCGCTLSEIALVYLVFG